MGEQTEGTSSGYALSEEEKRLRLGREQLDLELAKEIVAAGSENSQALQLLNDARERLKFVPLTHDEAMKYVGDIVYQQQVRKEYMAKARLESSQLPKVDNEIRKVGQRHDLTEKGRNFLIQDLNKRLGHLGVKRRIVPKPLEPGITSLRGTGPLKK